MNIAEPTIRVAVDPCNPGQFFACCGLLELADRIWPGTEGWFSEGVFCLLRRDGAKGDSLAELLSSIHAAKLIAVDENDEMATPLCLPAPFGLRLDWWRDEFSGGSELKTWAGQQKVVRIARAMQATLMSTTLTPETLLNVAGVLYDPADPQKTVEPFYFDARRSAQAQSVDVGFSPDAQGMTMPVYAAAEFLCLVGLQRFRPTSAEKDGTRTYRTWPIPLLPAAAAAIVNGGIAISELRQFRFRLLYRTKYLKGFLTALPERGEL